MQMILLDNVEEIFELVHLPPGLHDSQRNFVQQGIGLPQPLCELAVCDRLVHGVELLIQHAERVHLQAETENLFQEFANCATLSFCTEEFYLRYPITRKR